MASAIADTAEALWCAIWLPGRQPTWRDRQVQLEVVRTDGTTITVPADDNGWTGGSEPES